MWVPQQQEELMKEPRAAMPAGGAAAVVAAGTRLRLGFCSVGPRVMNKQQGPWTTFHTVSVSDYTQGELQTMVETYWQKN